MIDVANLRPSDIETLIEEGLSGPTVDAILSGISRMVKEVHPDGGADSDRIHLTANMLAMAGVWKAIQPAELARALDGGQHENIVVFLEGLPPKYNREVAYELITGGDKVNVPISDGVKLVGVGYGTNTLLSELGHLGLSGVHLWAGLDSGQVSQGPRLEWRVDPQTLVVTASGFGSGNMPVERSSDIGRLKPTVTVTRTRPQAKPRNVS
ncbi:hypothetical protein [Rhizobium sp. H4]|uniref:hypothetical protein n=1 Tax=Rhizobium sp. H4 TaxID=2035449 RepID=UPI000D0E6586|nr:hypothetical protein [Rhizobium sp. H4]